MHHVLAASVVSFSVFASAASSVITLDTGWVIQRGDNSAWAAAAFDDRAWPAARIGIAWEKAGHAGYDGYAWYRVRFVVPEEWRREKGLVALGNESFLVLSLGYIDDVDETYWNGKKIGTTGFMPPRYRTTSNGTRYRRDTVYALR